MLWLIVIVVMNPLPLVSLGVICISLFHNHFNGHMIFSNDLTFLILDI